MLLLRSYLLISAFETIMNNKKPIDQVRKAIFSRAPKFNSILFKNDKIIMKSKKTNPNVKFLEKTLIVKIKASKLKTAIFFLLMSTFFAAELHAAGANDVDPNFNVQVQTNSFSTKSVSQMLVLPDDKILVAGGFNSFNRQPVSGFVRLTADGLLDPTFNNNLLAAGSYPSKIYRLPDGKILISGPNLKLAGANAPSPQILRLNANGTIDTTFNLSGLKDFSVFYIAVGTDGKMLVSGEFPTTENGVTIFKFLTRLNQDGTLDNSFNFTGKSSVSQIALQNGKPIIVVTDIQTSRDVISRLNNDGSNDSLFTPTSVVSPVRFISITADSKILESSQFDVRRLNENGGIDNSFQTINLGGTLRDFYVGGDGKITYAFTENNAVSIRRALADGTSDSSFTAYRHDYFGVLAVQSDGEVFVGDTTNQLPGTTIVNRYVHLFGSGAPDTAFNPGGIGFQNISSGSINAIVVQPDQKIVMAGKFDMINNVNRSKIVRLNADNTIDNSFQINTNAPGNYFSRIDQIYSLSLQPNGKIIVSGSFEYILDGNIKVNLVRLNADGSIDATFNIGASLSDFYGATGGGKNATATQSDGKLVVATSRYNTMGVTVPMRFNTDGTKDSTFNTSLYSAASGIFTYAVAIQPNGKILIGGVGFQNNAQFGFLVRLNGDGSIDSSFQKIEESDKAITAINLLADGKILVVKGSYPYYFAASQTSFVSRLNTDGSADGTFAVGAGANGYVNTTLLLPNGQLLIGGKFTTFNGQARQNLALINADGSLDATNFNVNQEVLSLAIDGSSRILVGGSFTVISINNGENYTRSYVARLTAASSVGGGRVRFDFNGDGLADVGTFSASTGIWSILNSQNSQIIATQFGQTGDKYAPADYDGDGKTDLAVYRPSNGTWYLLQSTAGFAAVQWGTAEDKPIAGDYDGDGKAEIAVWRPSTGVWYILRNPNQYIFFQFGTAGDIPLSADLDGDGKTEIAVFRPSNGTFYWGDSGSNNLFRAVQFGQNGDVPAVADYNGDGKADLVVWRPSSGIWYQYLTTANGSYTFSAVQFGLNGDEPVPADYDGDGKTDIAVRRGTIWYLLKSTQGISAVTFGSATAPPVAALQN